MVGDQENTRSLDYSSHALLRNTLNQVEESCSLPSGASWVITVETRQDLS